MRYQRLVSTLIQELVTKFPALILTGPRQVGKTATIKALFHHYNYITLELPSDAQWAESDPEDFLRHNPPPLIIEEVHYAPSLFLYLREAMSKKRNKPGLFILTSSQKFDLMKEISLKLAERCACVEIDGLSLEELTNNDKLDFTQVDNFHRAMIRGLHPELWTYLHLRPIEHYRNYLASFLERDVRKILNISSLRNYEQFVRICAKRSGQLINKSEMAKELGITLNTVTQWLNVLESCGHITLLRPFSHSLGQRNVKTAKLYFSEIGLLSFLLKIIESEIDDSPYKQIMYETMFFNELSKYIKNHSLKADLWFYRDNRSQEVSFICEINKHIELFEISTNEKLQDQELASFVKTAQLFNQESLKNHIKGRCYFLTVNENLVSDQVEIAHPIDALKNLLVYKTK
jgi:uncharacterized protein